MRERLLAVIAPPAAVQASVDRVLAQVEPAGVEGMARTESDGRAAFVLAVHRADRQQTLAALVGHPRWSEGTLAATAADRGHAQALLDAYLTHGQDLLRHLHGHFACVVLDPGRRRLFAAVDRLGTYPLAYALGRDAIAIATDLDLLALGPGGRGLLSIQAIYEYLYAHVVPSPHAIHAGMHKLGPAERVLVEDGSIDVHRYWNVPYSESASAPLAAQAQELLEHLESAVRREAPGPETGSFLSGGLDSSTVTGMLARVRGTGNADAYGIGFAVEGYDEMAFARSAARHFGVRLHEYYVTPDDVLAAIPRVARAYDEPFGNASAVPAYHCALQAHGEGRQVLLAGDGGDEIFGGNARYAKQKMFEFYARLPGRLRARLLEPLLARPWAGRVAPLRKLRSYVEQARLPMPERLETYNFLNRTPLDAVFTGDFRAAIDRDGPVTGLRAAYFGADSPMLLKRMMHLDLKITLADNDLRKVRRMCELAGIDVRFPMLDEDLVAFAARVPAERLLRRFELRSFYKHALRDFLPQTTLTKSKHGFGLPFGLWMNEHAGLRALACDSLQSLRGRGWFEPAWLDGLLRLQRDGHAGYYGVMIWVLMMLEQWLTAREL